ncbi:RimM-like 16S rRNA processing protein [Dorcoceras hygrometricum]|uniref:RimM-like 16S rRNA processing protein n=1 Tax=Dorcoceras hygrometricum TaxID=472368 RepID=A0A2Z7AV17_9LAMI|nr:RimM-like 16S rRNA processing protein [Dorcoceras hygrometricum]
MFLVDWAVNMRIRPPEFETSICDAKYHVSLLHSRCHYSYLQDVCIAIGSIATLDLPMVVDLIGIFGLKGPYCTLTTTNWFLQALSVIPRGSWGDVARRFTMIHWLDSRPSPPLQTPPSPPAVRRRKFVSGQLDEENPFVQNSSVLVVQADEGVSVLVVDRICDIYRSLPRRADVIVTTVGARHKCQQGLFLEVRTSMSYISPSSTSEGSTRRFDLKTSCTDPIPQPAAVRTPRLHKCTSALTV